MTYIAKHPAAFINAIAEEGTKEEAVYWLQKIWDELCDLEKQVAKFKKNEENPKENT